MRQGIAGVAKRPKNRHSIPRLLVQYAPMSQQPVNTLIIGAGQAGLAVSAHLKERGISHRLLESHRIVEHWRTRRWDSLRANGPAWHDRFPAQEFDGIGPDDFASRDDVVRYFETFAERIEAPVQSGVTVTRVTRHGDGFRVETTDGDHFAERVVSATGAFQHPIIPPVVPEAAPVTQLHSADYQNPEQLPAGAVLVIGAGSSGTQIADELLRSGRRTFLSIGPHERPPRSYRGRDFVWWLGTLGKWQMKTPPAGREHVTIAVSGAHGGETVDFRRLADRGMTLLGMTETYTDGRLGIADDLVENVKAGDENYLSLLAEADAWLEREGINMPPDPEAHVIGPDPYCMTDPIRELDLVGENIRTIVWATGYRNAFDWLQVDGAVDDSGKPQHQQGISNADGVYFLGLPWLSMRGSSFIWGVWDDAQFIAEHIAAQTTS